MLAWLRVAVVPCACCWLCVASEAVVLVGLAYVLDESASLTLLADRLLLLSAASRHELVAGVDLG